MTKKAFRIDQNEMFYQFSGLSAAIATALWLLFIFEYSAPNKVQNKKSVQFRSPKEDLCIFSTTKKISPTIADIKF